MSLGWGGDGSALHGGFRRAADEGDCLPCSFGGCTAPRRNSERQVGSTLALSNPVAVFVILARVPRRPPRRARLSCPVYRARAQRKELPPNPAKSCFLPAHFGGFWGKRPTKGAWRRLSRLPHHSLSSGMQKTWFWGLSIFNFTVFKIPKDRKT
jgi:hypothetical protein